MRVAVVGAGPSGLMAAWAVVNAGHSVRLFDKDPTVVARNHGVFYLHAQCELPISSQRILIRVMGAPPGSSIQECSRLYAEKVYGDSTVPVSLTHGTETVYHAGEAIEWLKALFQNDIEKATFTSLGDIVGLLDGFYDKVIVTAPAKLFLPGPFESVVSYVRHTECRQGEWGTLWYNVGEAPWTRVSQVFGIQAVEQPTPGPGLVQVRKVITAPPELFRPALFPPPPDLIWTGRYGRWDKSILTHTVFYQVLDALGANPLE